MHATARSIYTIALGLVLVGPAWPDFLDVTPVEAIRVTPLAVAPDEAARQYLNGLGATNYTLTPIQDSYVAASFPSYNFFEVIFQQYPAAVEPPEGLNPSDIIVVQGDKVFVLTGPDNLKTFFLSTVAPVADEDGAANAGQSWLRLTEVFSQDGFFTFSDPAVSVIKGSDGGVTVLGEVDVATGGDGGIVMAMDFDANGQITDMVEDRQVQVGSRPI